MSSIMQGIITVGLLVAVSTTLTARGADPLDTWAISNTSNLTGGLRAITFAQGQFVAVGDGGTIATSLDGDKWTLVHSGTDVDLRAICYAGGQYVSVGGTDHGRQSISVIITSPDGVNWIERYRGSSLLLAVSYGKDRFVAVGGPDAVLAPILLFSDDGVNWTPGKGEGVRPGIDAPALNGVAYGNGLFVAVSPGAGFTEPLSAAYVSTDGIDWVRFEGQTGLRALVFENRQFVAVGGYTGSGGGYLFSQTVIATSRNGTGWTLSAGISSPGGVMQAIAYGAGQFVAAGETAVFSSPDAQKWISHHVETVATGVAYGNGRFVLACGGIMRSGPIGPKLGASLSPEGQFVGQLSGVNGQQFSIQTSTNLVAWNSLTNVTITNGVGQFTDRLATNSSKCCYRAVSQY